MKLITVILLALPSLASAGLEDLSNTTFHATNFGCATPSSGRYVLSMVQNFSDYDSTEKIIYRDLRVVARMADTAPIKGACSVSYEGLYQGPPEEKNIFNGQLKRVSCTCTGAFAAIAERTCKERVDVFVAEGAESFSKVDFVGGQLNTQQLMKPTKPYPGCGENYPAFTFE